MKKFRFYKLVGVGLLASTSFALSGLNLNAENYLNPKVMGTVGDELSPENPYYLRPFWDFDEGFGVWIEGKYIDNPSPEKDYVEATTYRLADSQSVETGVNYVDVLVRWMATDPDTGVSYAQSAKASSYGPVGAPTLLQATVTSPAVFDDEVVAPPQHSYDTNYGE